MAVCATLLLSADSLLSQGIKNLSTRWKTWIQSLGREDPLEKGMDCTGHGVTELDTTERLALLEEAPDLLLQLGREELFKKKKRK